MTPPEDKAPDMPDDCDCYFTARFKIKHAIDDEALKEDFNGDLLAAVKWLLSEEHIHGVAEDDYEILAASRTIQSPDQGAVDSRAQGAIEELEHFLAESCGDGDDYYSDVREPITTLISQVRSYHRALSLSGKLVTGKCSKTGIKYADAIKEMQEITAECDAYGARAKTPLPVRVRVLVDAIIEQALTRPTLDLAKIKMELYNLRGETKHFLNVSETIDLYLDHLQAIRPDLFGGKK